MEEQAKQLAAAVSVFRVSGGAVATPAKAVIAKAQAAAKAAPAGAAVGAASAANARSRARLAAAAKAPRLAKPKTPADDEWAEF